MESTNEIVKVVEELIGWINNNPNLEKNVNYEDYEDYEINMVSEEFWKLWKQLSKTEKEELFNKYFERTNSLFLKTLLVENGLPEKKEYFEKYIDDYSQRDIEGFFYMWLRLSDEEKLRVISEKKDAFLKIFSENDIFDYDLMLR